MFLFYAIFFLISKKQISFHFFNFHVSQSKLKNIWDQICIETIKRFNVFHSELKSIWDYIYAKKIAFVFCRMRRSFHHRLKSFSFENDLRFHSQQTIHQLRFHCVYHFTFSAMSDRRQIVDKVNALIWHREDFSIDFDDRKIWKLCRDYDWTFEKINFSSHEIDLDDWLIWKI